MVGDPKRSTAEQSVSRIQAEGTCMNGHGTPANPMDKTWTINTIFGIPLRIHSSWLLVLGFVAVAMQGSYRNDVSAGDLLIGEPGLWILGFVTALLFFASLVLHELGHSLVALRQGVKVRSITLFMFGGVATVERESSTAFGSLLVAAAGPAVSFLLAALMVVLRAFTSESLPVVALICSHLITANLVLGFFNLLPGLPLDGGLILKALVWQWSGSRDRGTQVAATTGQLLSVLGLVFGFCLVLLGQPAAGVWLILLAFMGLRAAIEQLQLLKLQQQLRSITVQQAQARRFRVLEADMTLQTVSRLLADGATPGDPPEWLLVCSGHRWLGRFSADALKTLPVQCWPREEVGRVLQPLDALTSIQDVAPLWEAALALEQASEQRLLVLNGAGLPSGTLDRIDLVEAVCRGLSLRLPELFLNHVRRHGVYPPGLPLDAIARMMASGAEAAPQPSAGDG